MSTLTKSEIIHRIKTENLIIDAYAENGEYCVEPASYDLRVGTIILKESNNNKEIRRKDFDPKLTIEMQDMVTIHPGQVVFVVTKEQIKMPLDLCGTVYAKNSFSRNGILLFTTGHVDPGIQCPIVIRLVNLRSTPFALMLGHPIYTIVFQTLNKFKDNVLEGHNDITMKTTIDRTIKSAEEALSNSLYDLSLLNDFVKKEDFAKEFWIMIKFKIYKIIAWTVAILVAIATIISGWPTLEELFRG